MIQKALFKTLRNVSYAHKTIKFQRIRKSYVLTIRVGTYDISGWGICSISDCFDVIIMYKLLPDSVKFILSKSTDTSPESRV